VSSDLLDLDLGSRLGGKAGLCGHLWSGMEADFPCGCVCGRVGGSFDDDHLSGAEGHVLDRNLVNYS
jgi:hypothetical protein